MLTLLFKAWCTGHDLKQDSELWNDAFTTHNFGTQVIQLMHNMNICYECLDAQDDFHAQMKKGAMTLPAWLADEDSLKYLDQTVIYDQIEDDYLDNFVEDIGISVAMGKKTKACNLLMNAINCVLTVTGWTECNAKLLPNSINLKPAVLTMAQSASQWKAAVVSKHAQVLKQKGQHLHTMESTNNNTKPKSFVPNEVKIVTKTHLTQTFESSKWGPTMNAVLNYPDKIKNHIGW